MRPEALTYVSSQRTCVVAVEMLDGSPHAATVHFALTSEPKFVFLTDRKYRKVEPLLQSKETRASVVIGTKEEEMKTLQMDGIISISSEPTHVELYYQKFTEKDKKNLNENDVFLVFTPTWWRFTDWTLPDGKTVFDSDRSVDVPRK